LVVQLTSGIFAVWIKEAQKAIAGVVEKTTRVLRSAFLVEVAVEVGVDEEAGLSFGYLAAGWSWRRACSGTNTTSLPISRECKRFVKRKDFAAFCKRPGCGVVNSVCARLFHWVGKVLIANVSYKLTYVTFRNSCIGEYLERNDIQIWSGRVLFLSLNIYRGTFNKGSIPPLAFAQTEVGETRHYL
jgi:hypothetical protein